MHTIPNLSAPLDCELFATLCGLLPPPGEDTPEARAARDELAMASAAALLPETAFEANLAAGIVAAQAYAKHCLRLAAQFPQDPWEARRCIAQASAMLRHARSGLAALRRTQALREKAETEMRPAAMERAGYWFREASMPEPARPAPAEPAAAQPATPPESAHEELAPVRRNDRGRAIRRAVPRPRGPLPGHRRPACPPRLRSRPRPTWWTPSSAAPVRSCGRSTTAHEPLSRHDPLPGLGRPRSQSMQHHLTS